MMPTILFVALVHLLKGVTAQGPTFTDFPQTITASFEGPDFASSKGVYEIATKPTLPSVTPTPESFCYGGLLFYHLFPGEIRIPEATHGLPLPVPTNVVPKSPPNLAVYNPIFDQPGAPNLEPASISLDFKCNRTAQSFDLRSLCYSCIAGVPEGAINPPLHGKLEIKGSNSGGDREAETFPFTPNGNNMKCVNVPQESLKDVQKLELRCNGGLLKLAIELDDMVFVLH